jgi:hypothetical protein
LQELGGEKVFLFKVTICDLEESVPFEVTICDLKILTLAMRSQIVTASPAIAPSTLPNFLISLQKINIGGYRSLKIAITFTKSNYSNTSAQKLLP